MGYELVSSLKGNLNCEQYSKLTLNQLLGKYLENDDKAKLEVCLAKNKDQKRNQTHIQFFASIDSLIKNEKNITNLVKLDRYLKNYENFLAKSARILSFLQVNNQAKAESLIKEIVKKDVSFYILNSETVIWDFYKSKDYLLRVLILIHEKIKNQKLFEIFKFYIYANSSGTLQDAIDDQFEIKKGLIYLNKQFESNNYGREFLLTWGPKIYEESSEFSYRNFLKRHLKQKTSGRLDLSTILFYRNKPLNNLEAKNTFSMLNSYYLGDKLEDLFIIQQILAGNYFRDSNKSNLNKSKDLLHLSSFSGQRRFFHKLKKENLKIGLIHLISLGDFPEDDINELIKYEQ